MAHPRGSPRAQGTGVAHSLCITPGALSQHREEPLNQMWETE